METRYKILILILSGLAILLIILFVLLSFSSIGNNQVGLDYNSISVSVSTSTLYSTGRYYLGVGHSFIAYNIGFQTISFSNLTNTSLIARSNDGLKISFDIDFQFSLYQNIQNISALYNKYNTDYLKVYINLSKSVLCRSVSLFNSTQIYMNITGLTNQMISDLKSALFKENSELQNLQILHFLMPDSFSNEVSNTQVQNLYINIANNNLNNTIVEIQGKLSQAKIEANIIKNQADELVQNLYLLGNVTTQNKKNYYLNVKQGYLKLKQLLNFGNQDLITYLFTSKSNNNSYFNYQIPKLISCTSNSSLPQCI